MSSVSIKQAIKTKLDGLVTDGVLGGASISDLRKDPLSDIPTYPHAFLTPPSMESEVVDNRSILRTYIYDILLVWKAENITDGDTIEEDIENVVTAFDNDPTLGGEAIGGVLPVSSAPQPIQHTANQLIVAQVQIQAKQHVSLDFA